MPPVKAIVLDANTWNRYLSLQRLRWIANSLKDSNIAVWIPWYVVLEWASHHSKQIVGIRSNYKWLLDAGLADQVLPDADPSSIIMKFEEQIRQIPNVAIIAPSGKNAIHGLTDQILGTGAGTTKSDVKTGGVDSAWIRDVIDHAGGQDQIQDLIFVTENKSDLVKTVGDIDRQLKPRATQIYKVWSELGVPKPLEPNHVVALADSIELDLYAHTIEIRDSEIDNDLLEGFPTGVQVGLRAEYDENSPFAIGAAEYVTLPDSGGKGKTRTIVNFRLLLCADVYPDLRVPDSSDPGREDLLYAGPIPAVIAANCTTELKAGSEDVDAPTIIYEDFRVSSPTQWYENGSDALHGFAESVSSLSGIVLESDSDLIGGHSGRVLAPNGNEAFIKPDYENGSEWTLSISLVSSPDDTTTLSCHRSPDVERGSVRFEGELYYLGPEYQVPDLWPVVAQLWRRLIQADE